MLFIFVFCISNNDKNVRVCENEWKNPMIRMHSFCASLNLWREFFDAIRQRMSTNFMQILTRKRSTRTCMYTFFFIISQNGIDKCHAIKDTFVKFAP